MTLPGRLLSLLLFFLFSGAFLPLFGQQFVRSEAGLETSALSSGDLSRLYGLEERLETFLDSYRISSPSLTLVPKHPMRVSLSLAFLPERSISGDYLCDVRFTAYRPLYGSESETPILVALESRLALDPAAASALYFEGGTLPEDPFLLRLHYLTTLALLSYYDSFNLNGGDPFLGLLRSNAPGYRRAFEAETSLLPPSLLMSEELETAEGREFRELWLLLHLEVLDVSPLSPDALETLSYVADRYKALYDSGRVPALFQTLQDAKGGTLSGLLAGLSPSEREALSKKLSPLFPALL